MAGRIGRGKGEKPDIRRIPADLTLEVRCRQVYLADLYFDNNEGTTP